MFNPKPDSRFKKEYHDPRVSKAAYFTADWFHNQRPRGFKRPNRIDALRRAVDAASRFLDRVMRVIRKEKQSPDPLPDLFEMTAYLALSLGQSQRKEIISKPEDVDAIVAYVMYAYYRMMIRDKGWRRTAARALLLIDEAYCQPMDLELIDFCRQYTHRIEKEYKDKPWYKRRKLVRWDDE